MKGKFIMNNNNQPQISVNTRSISWAQNTPLDTQQIFQTLGVYVTNSKGVNITNSATLDLSRIDVNMTGQYHGTINVTDPNSGLTNYLNFDVNVLPASMIKQQTNNKKQANKKKKIIAIVVILLAIILGVTACHHHDQQVAKQAQTDQAIADNKNGIKSNAQANAAMQKQIDDLKKAQAQYQKDHNDQAYKDRIANLENENQRLQNQTHDGDIQDRLEDMYSGMENIAANPQNTSENADTIKQKAGLNNLWNQIQATVTNWLNS